jgi:HEPN domain-containing protein
MNNLQISDIESFAGTICFHAQQAVEKYLKAFLIYNNIDFPRTHDVDFLIQECQQIDEKSFNIDLKSLTEFGVFFRYPDDFYVPGINETEEYIKIANLVSKKIERLISVE